jgi:hypothetical protein
MQTDFNAIVNALLVLTLITLDAAAVFFIYDEMRVLKNNAALWKKNYLNLHKQNNTQTMTPTAIRTELDALINQTKGKFFSITFVKNDGSTRIINGKDKYNRLLKGGSDTVRQAGYVPFVNRNTENWVCAHNDRVVTFQCGKVKKEMQVSI